MYSYTLLSLFLWTLLGLVAAIPTEILTIEDADAAEEYDLDNFNNTDGSIIPQPRFSQVNSIGKTYTFYFFNVNWFTAMEFCSFYGQSLASIRNFDEKIHLIGTFPEYGIQYSSDSFWLGASDLGHYGQWVWLSNGDSVDHAANWQTGAPNNNDYHCMEMLGNGQWNNANCYEKRQFICESI